VTLRALIVDDEAPSRDELRYLLAEHDDVKVVGEAAGAGEALELAESTRYDVVFCDVEMPERSGLDVARVIQAQPSKPALVFVTAHESYAVDAFAVEAFDYLLKPVDPVRLARLLERLREARLAVGAAVEKIPVVGSSGSTTLLDDTEVVFVRAEGDYSRVHTFDRSYLCTSSLRELEELLPPSRFTRVHRSTLVNLAKVAALGRAGPERLRLTMDDRDRTELDVSRRLTRAVRDRLRL
jgi:two-component system, LytTR family, response regulator